MDFKLDQITQEIRRRIEQFEPRDQRREVGTVLSIGDGIARIDGLSDVMLTELLEFPGGVHGIALNLEREQVGAVVIGDFEGIEEGALVHGTGRIASIDVGEAMLGRVVDATGAAIDGAGPISTDAAMPIERVAAGVVERVNVDTPVQTGIKAVDAMTPIGRGQRQLIIGDRQTGKTALALDTIINQHDKDLLCIYVAIGQRQGQVAQVVATLREYGALDHTVVVVAGASDSAPLQYIAPYAGCAIGEYFMERGRDALVVYDDLSKHAWAYRQMSLLLRRPPGREAYPGDVFYLHSRLLERAARMSPERGNGSLTALPIIETLAGDVSAYVPTNVISITDGQIYLESDLFYAGQRPAVNVGISVSRVGGDAQTKAMKQVAGQLRLELAQYYALAAFAQFGSDLDTATREQLERGRRLTELLKQPQYAPSQLAHQIVALFALTHGHARQVPVARIGEYLSGLLQHVDASHPHLLQAIATEQQLSEELEAALDAAVADYTRTSAPQDDAE